MPSFVLPSSKSLAESSERRQKRRRPEGKPFWRVFLLLVTTILSIIMLAASNCGLHRRLSGAVGRGFRFVDVVSASSVPAPNTIFHTVQTKKQQQRRWFHNSLSSSSSSSPSALTIPNKFPFLSSDQQRRFGSELRGGSCSSSVNDTTSIDSTASSIRSFSSSSDNTSEEEGKNATTTIAEKKKDQKSKDSSSSSSLPPPAINQSTSTPSSSSSSSSSPPTISKKLRNFEKRTTKVFRRTMSGIFSAVGFIGSALVGIDPITIQKRTSKPLKEFEKYLKATGIDLELKSALTNKHLGRNLILLARIQQQITTQSQQQQDEDGVFDNKKKSKKTKLPKQFWIEAKRYMKYATAAYGQAMISAAQVDAKGKFDGKLWDDSATLDSIAKHVGLSSSDDIVWMNLIEFKKSDTSKDNNDTDNKDDDLHHLKHYVAIDHQHKTVVLSIRGTFNLEEIVVDVTAMSKPFCNIGESHCEMATMAERVWDVASPTIIRVLKENPNYHFVITGHSLGAGTACLVNLMVHTQKLLSPSQLQNTKCYAYASPPVFTPLDLLPKQCLQSSYNFIHKDDCVPFLSVYAVRKLLAELAFIHKSTTSGGGSLLTNTQCAKIIFGFQSPPKELVNAIGGGNTSSQQRSLLSSKVIPSIEPKEGAPQLEVPVGKTIWLHDKEKMKDEDEENDDDLYSYQCLTPKEFKQKEIQLTSNMFLDHFPSAYEHALDNLETDENDEK